jgi:hypothetical protein
MQNRNSSSFDSWISPALASAVVIALVVFTAAGLHARGPQTSAGNAPQTAAEKYKNIQVLKEIPADQLIPTMQFISASLGVECDFCHSEGADKHLEFDKDDKKEKKTAREMMRMMMAINKDNFKGEREVTCNTCHRGAQHPDAIPAIMAEGAKPEPEEHEHAMDPATLPSGAPVLAKFLQAVGGDAALAKATSRVEQGKALMPEGPPTAITIYTKSPDERVSVMHTAKGDSVTAYNGHAGWLAFPGRPPRQMSAADQLAAKLDAEIFYPSALATQFGDLKLQHGSEKVGDREADVVLGLTKDQAPVKLYFDRSSGLLVRMVHYTNTALGLMPTQVDLGDYRDAGGVKTPYRWTIGRPSGSFTIQVESVESNAAIDAARFAPPDFSAPPTQGEPAGGPPPQGPKPPQGSVPSPGAAPAPSGMGQ